jgi:hypothetical protein
MQQDFQQRENFGIQIHLVGVHPSIEDLMKFSSLFASNFTLYDLDSPQLIALFKLLSLPFIGPDYYLSLQLHFKGIRNLSYVFND